MESQKSSETIPEDANPNAGDKKRKRRDVKRSAKTPEPGKGNVRESMGPGGATKEELPPTKKQKGAVERVTEVDFAAKDQSKTTLETKKHQKTLRKLKGRKSSDAGDVAVDTRELKPKGNIEMSVRKRKLEESVLPKPQPNKKNPNKRKRKDSGKEVVDKLDVLIELYRSKFSQRTSDNHDDENQGSRQLRRWFQS